MHGADEEKVTQKIQQKFKFQMNYSRVIPVQLPRHNVDGEIHVGYRKNNVMILCVTKQTGQKNFVKIPNESYQEIVRDSAKYLIKNLRFS